MIGVESLAQGGILDWYSKPDHKMLSGDFLDTSMDPAGFFNNHVARVPSKYECLYPKS